MKRKWMKIVRCIANRKGLKYKAKINAENILFFSFFNNMKRLNLYLFLRCICVCQSQITKAQFNSAFLLLLFRYTTLLQEHKTLEIYTHVN